MDTVFCRDRGFYRSFFSLCVMLMLEQAIVLGVGLLDNVMIGAYNETALAGVAAVNQLQFVLQQVMNGFATGVIVLGSQFWGKGLREDARRMASTGFYVSVGVSLLILLGVSVNTRATVSIFSPDEAVIAQGVSYLNIIRFSYPVFAATTLLLGSLRGSGSVRIAVVTSVISLCVNAGLNYTLIFGHFGAPELGARGAAIATLAARITELAVVSFYMFRMDKNLRMTPGTLFRARFDNLRLYMKVCVPSVIAGFSFGSSNAVQAMILGHMSSSALSANSIATTLYQLVKVMAVGASTAASITIGQTVGKGDRDHTIRCANSLQVIFLGIGLCVALVLFAVRIPILSLYSISQETYDLASSFILLLCVVGFFMSYQMPTNTGIIRGGGDVKFIMYVDLISIWFIVIPLSYLAAFVFDWPPVLVVLCLNSDQIFKSLPAFLRVNRHKWIRDLSAER